jgi:hypothetical protein
MKGKGKWTERTVAVKTAAGYWPNHLRGRHRRVIVREASHGTMQATYVEEIVRIEYQYVVEDQG